MFCFSVCPFCSPHFAKQHLSWCWVQQSVPRCWSTGRHTYDQQPVVKLNSALDVDSTVHLNVQIQNPQQITAPISPLVTNKCHNGHKNHTCCEATACNSLGAGVMGVAGTVTHARSASRNTGLVITATVSASSSSGSRPPCTDHAWAPRLPPPLLWWGVAGEASDS